MVARVRSHGRGRRSRRRTSKAEWTITTGGGGGWDDVDGVTGAMAGGAQGVTTVAEGGWRLTGPVQTPALHTSLCADPEAPQEVAAQGGIGGTVLITRTML